MTEHLIAILQENKAVTDYRINTTRTQSYEMFFVHRDLETVRATDTTDTKVTIYVDHDGKKGDAQFSVYSSATDDELREKIAEAVAAASVINNENYELPENETFTQTVPSNLASQPLRELAAQTAEAVFQADCYQNGSINALEIFLNQISESVCNSRGIHKSETKYTAMIEAIPTWNSSEDSVELYECYQFGQFNPQEITAEIDRRMREVRDRQLAQKPTQPLNCRVVLNAKELSELLENIVYELNYSKVYAHSNAYSKGDSVQKEVLGDPLSVTMRGALPGSIFSAFFDAVGVTLQDTQIIRDGQVVAYHGPSRFAQYLSEPITGTLPCIEAACGTLSAQELSSEPYFECVSMSGLQVDIYNDYIGGEVRLAYYHDGNTVTPLTGISISGKLSDALRNMRLSDHDCVYDFYKGPDKAAFTGIQIV